MTRAEALAIKELKFNNNGRPVETEQTDATKLIINKIYDDFENKKTCDGCINKPGANENYPFECGVCSRFYADEFEEKTDV